MKYTVNTMTGEVKEEGSTCSTGPHLVKELSKIRKWWKRFIIRSQMAHDLRKYKRYARRMPEIFYPSESCFHVVFPNCSKEDPAPTFKCVKVHIYDM